MMLFFLICFNNRLLLQFNQTIGHRYRKILCLYNLHICIKQTNIIFIIIIHNRIGTLKKKIIFLIPTRIIYANSNF